MNKEKTIFFQEKKQKILILVFFLVLFLTFFILWKGYVRPPPTELPEEEFFERKKAKREIDLSILENPILKELQEIPQISPPSSDEIGKENPFLP